MSYSLFKQQKSSQSQATLSSNSDLEVLAVTSYLFKMIALRASPDGVRVFFFLVLAGIRYFQAV
jgi:hypothetical protein